MRRMEGLRNRKQVLKAVKELDAFPKIPEGYQESSATGGGISILVFVIILVLVISEVGYYTATELKYDYVVDTYFSTKLSINIDMTVAMKCHQIGADVLDLTGQSVTSFGNLEEEDVYFDLSPQQRQHFDSVRSINDYIRNEYHAIHKFLWKSGFGGYKAGMPAREDKPIGAKNGCRLHGSLEVNKVAGNFHVTAGKSVPVIPRGHAHLAMMVKEQDYNFSHRIEHFSFGEGVAGRINPLDGEEKIIDKNYHMYQYFMQVVPTAVSTAYTEIDTYQYAVTERNRTIEHSKGSHGVPGIFVKYDLSPMKVKVLETHKPYSQFLVRLCGIIGGIFATSGMLHNLLSFLFDLACCRLKLGRYSPKDRASPTRTSVNSSNHSPHPTPPQTHTNNAVQPDIVKDSSILTSNVQAQTLDLLTGAESMAATSASMKGSLLAQDSFMREDSVS